jgi:hypothetical protein
MHQSWNRSGQSSPEFSMGSVRSETRVSRTGETRLAGLSVVIPHFPCFLPPKSTAAPRRSRGVVWPSIAPALSSAFTTAHRAPISTCAMGGVVAGLARLNTDFPSLMVSATLMALMAAGSTFVGLAVSTKAGWRRLNSMNTSGRRSIPNLRRSRKARRSSARRS